jgi:hypothetical protein
MQIIFVLWLFLFGKLTISYDLNSSQLRERHSNAIRADRLTAPGRGGAWLLPGGCISGLGRGRSSSELGRGNFNWRDQCIDHLGDVGHPQQPLRRSCGRPGPPPDGRRPSPWCRRTGVGSRRQDPPPACQRCAPPDFRDEKSTVAYGINSARASTFRGSDPPSPPSDRGFLAPRQGRRRCTRGVPILRDPRRGRTPRPVPRNCPFMCQRDTTRSRATPSLTPCRTGSRRTWCRRRT